MMNPTRHVQPLSCHTQQCDLRSTGTALLRVSSRDSMMAFAVIHTNTRTRYSQVISSLYDWLEVKFDFAVARLSTCLLKLESTAVGRLLATIAIVALEISIYNASVPTSNGHEKYAVSCAMIVGLSVSRSADITRRKRAQVHLMPAHTTQPIKFETYTANSFPHYSMANCSVHNPWHPTVH